MKMPSLIMVSASYKPCGVRKDCSVDVSVSTLAQAWRTRFAKVYTYDGGVERHDV